MRYKSPLNNKRLFTVDAYKLKRNVYNAYGFKTQKYHGLNNVPFGEDYSITEYNEMGGI